MTATDFSSHIKQSIAQLTDPGVDVSNLSLTNCDREPIQIPNATQAHGVLLTFAETDLTGFDRVMLYRFENDGSGTAIAEAKSAQIDSFLGWHYPASDIPQQAKELYRLNLLRIIPDVFYDPIPLEPALNPVTGAPLDLSLSVLRSVSPMHTEYLRNMGVQASMSISLLQDRQLWGLIACHHDVPKQLSYETRTICEFLGQVISFEVGAKADAEAGLQNAHPGGSSPICEYDRRW